MNMRGFVFMCMVTLVNLPRVTLVSGAPGEAINPGFVMEDLLEYPKFQIKFNEKPLMESRANGRMEELREMDPESKENEASLRDPIILRTKEGWKFLCEVPWILPANTTEAERPVISDQDDQTAIERGLELLSPMNGGCITRAQGWWSYEYCHGSYVKQFHPQGPNDVDDGMIVQYKLGDYNHKKLLSSNEHDNDDVRAAQIHRVGRKRFLSQIWAGGTLCDLTRQPREIEIQFHCDPNNPDRISHIKEVSTCKYLMIISTPRLCQDPSFYDPAALTVNSIICSQIISDREYKQRFEKPALPETEANENEEEPEEISVEVHIPVSTESTTTARTTQVKQSKDSIQAVKRLSGQPIIIDLTDSNHLQEIMEQEKEAIKKILEELYSGVSAQNSRKNKQQSGSNRKRLQKEIATNVYSDSEHDTDIQAGHDEL